MEQCPNCLYSWRGLADGTLCPECGRFRKEKAICIRSCWQQLRLQVGWLVCLCVMAGFVLAANLLVKGFLPGSLLFWGGWIVMPALIIIAVYSYWRVSRNWFVVLDAEGILVHLSAARDIRVRWKDIRSITANRRYEIAIATDAETVRLPGDLRPQWLNIRRFAQCLERLRRIAVARGPAETSIPLPLRGK